MIKDRVEQFLDKIKKMNKKLNALLDIYEEEALKRAEMLDNEAKKGRRGKLFGKIAVVKNNIAIKGKRLTCASKILEHYYAPYNASVIDKINDEGAVIIGSANMDEFACGSDNTKSAFGNVKNPIDNDYVPGGSSGGSACSVKAGFCDFALGSDTGGSIRCPAAFCNVVGFKPSYAAVSRYGLADLGMSLDQIGPLAMSVNDVEDVFLAIRGIDYKDNTTFFYKPNDAKEKPKIAVIKEILEGSEDIVKQELLSALENEDYELVSIPGIDMAIAIYYLNVCAEFSSAMQRYDGIRYGKIKGIDERMESIAELRGKYLGEEVKRRIIMGTFITSKEYVDAWYKKALRARQALKERIESIFSKYNCIITPTMTTLPWKFNEKKSALQMYLADIATVTANLTGLPAGSVPYKSEHNREKFGIGIQVMANYGRDMHCLHVMKHFEKKSKID
ncbi:MAG: Asp-tRNA(Asn)/Glu-tRNA(Gln) amidotransferase subunit GatA [Candidatus Anstonellales archaeon]